LFDKQHTWRKESSSSTGKVSFTMAKCSIPLILTKIELSFVLFDDYATKWKEFEWTFVVEIFTLTKRLYPSYRWCQLSYMISVQEKSSSQAETGVGVRIALIQ
jgi:hypothetical protein